MDKESNLAVRQMRNIQAIFFFLLVTASCFAQQSKIDSLENVLKTAKEDTNKVLLLNRLSKILDNDMEKSKKYSEYAIDLSKKLNYRYGIAIGLNGLGYYYRVSGNTDKSLKYRLETLKILEELDDKEGIAGCLNNIGNLYYLQNNLDKALEFFLKGLEIVEQIQNKKGMANSYNNVASVYKERKDFKKALEYYEKSEKSFKELNEKKGLASTLNNIGTIWDEWGNYKKALEYYTQSLHIKEELDYKEGIAASFLNIGETYHELGEILQAITYFQKSLKVAQEINSKNDIYTAAYNLAESYAAQNDFRNAYEYHQLYSQMKDSLFNEESQKQIAEMQTKYETEKKEQQIKLLNKDKEIQNKDLQRQKTIRNSVAGGLIMVLLFSFVLINRLLLIRKQKKVIEVEREKSEKLLLNILPKNTADELKLTGKAQPRFYEMVTVMFTDFKGFTTIAEKMSAEELVSELDFIFKKFDEIISKYPIEKIKTIGDAYMCAGGLPVVNTTNAMDVVLAALEIQNFMLEQNKWQLRLGIHTGSVIAGVVGDKKFAYDIWGDAVNTASRMESGGEAGKVNISGSTYNLIKDKLQTTNYQLQTIFRGKIPAKNKGEIEMYFVERMS